MFHYLRKAAQSGANPFTEGFTETFIEGFRSPPGRAFPSGQ